jgi:phosphotransferase family enzyme
VPECNLDMPRWMPSWCAEHLGGTPVEMLFVATQMSTVIGVRLSDGSRVVVKAREDDGRVASCVAAQSQLAERGLPCARPLTAAIRVGALAVHAEEYRDDGDIVADDSPEVGARYGAVFARLMIALQEVAVTPPLPNPRWVRWDHTGHDLWPAIDILDGRDQSTVPSFVVETALRTRRRLLVAELPPVLGHADFEAQNLRWNGRQVSTVHDWDSLAWQPESALVGAASGVFPRPPGVPPSLASIESSEAFMASYQQVRQRNFSAE